MATVTFALLAVGACCAAGACFFLGGF